MGWGGERPAGAILQRPDACCVLNSATTQFGNSALDSAIAQEQFGTLALLRHIVSTQEWWANAKGGTGSAATTAGGFGGIHVLRQVLETGAESQWRGEESRGRARLV